MTANSLQNRVGSGNRWSRPITVLQRVQINAQVGADERGQAGHVLIPYRVALGLQLADGGVQVDRVQSTTQFRTRPRAPSWFSRPRSYRWYSSPFLPWQIFLARAWRPSCRLRMPL